LNLAAEQEKTVVEKWLPELKTAVLNAQKSSEDCKYVGGLVSKLPSLEVKSSVVNTVYTIIISPPPPPLSLTCLLVEKRCAIHGFMHVHDYISFDIKSLGLGAQ
jgi:hypothetical protein